METLTHCKKCGAPIPTEQIYEDLQFAQCVYCGLIFGPGALQASKVLKPRRKPLRSPTGVETTSTNDELHITFTWLRTKFFWLELFVFIIAWIGAGWFFLSVPLTNPLQAVFYGTVLLVAILLSYPLLAVLINVTSVEVSAKQLRIRHTPLPGFTQHALNARTLKQLYVKKDFDFFYKLLARGADNQDISLLTNIRTVPLLLYIEQEVEKYLNIPDQPISGEYNHWT